VKSSEHSGAFKILGRLSQDIIKKAGYKISALELEQVLHKNNKVGQSAVFGVPCEEYGEEIVAKVVLKPGETSSSGEMESYMKEQVSSYKIPRVWEFVD